MKVDRILEIIIYLINHDNVPASYLAERFHVSVRTIQRDMVSISSIGIPVYAEGGKYGGYSILPTYKIRNSDIRNDEQQMIIKALESLATSYTSDTLKALIEKYNAIIEKEGGQKVFWDFGVTRENNHVQNINNLLEQAIAERKHITFNYRNASGKKSKQYVEPLAIHYKWYAWYLFSYSPEKKQYRTFKVARIQNLHVNDIVSIIEHGNIEKLTETVSRIFIDVPAKERLWKALLLSFGNEIKVIGPESYKKELIETAKNFLSNYDI